MVTIARWLPLLLAAGLGMEPSPEGLVVHEWGTLTSVVGGDGVPIPWHPLRPRSDLPGFVYVGIPKGRPAATVRMETPVLYFYSGRETVASVKVEFPGGQITEWYPSARWAPSRLEWSRFQVRPEAAGPLRREARDSHYYRARQTDAALVEVGSSPALQHERFLFYRGVGNCRLPASVRLAGETVEVASAAEVGPVVLFERHGGLVGYRRQDLAAGETFLERPVLGDSRAALRAELHQMLVESGLYPREAAAMLATWDESWFEEGLRLFYILPAPKRMPSCPCRSTPSRRSACGCWWPGSRSSPRRWRGRRRTGSPPLRQAFSRADGSRRRSCSGSWAGRTTCGYEPGFDAGSSARTAAAPAGKG